VGRERGTRPRFTAQAVAALARHPWPGNVRELANLIERLAILYGEAPIGEDLLPARIRGASGGSGAHALDELLARAEPVAPPLAEGPALPPGGLDLKMHLDVLEQHYIRQALDATHHVVAHAAQLLRMRRTTLVEKMRKYGLQREVPTPDP
jgi:sigma-54 dependent transcriptional regulator, flagellar regulatory protein